MKYNIKFKGTEEQIAKIARILAGQGVQMTPNVLYALDRGTLCVEDAATPFAYYSAKKDYDNYSFKEVDPAGFIDAHSDLPGNPWMANTGVAPDTGNAPLFYLMHEEIDEHRYDMISECSSRSEELDWDLGICLSILKWRFANMEDAEKWYARKNKERFMSGFGALKGKDCFVEERAAVAKDKPTGVSPTGPIKSDGGSSDYYKLKLTLKDGSVVECETGDVIRAMVGNDFDLGNVIKAVRRIYQASLGQGKEGIDVNYDRKKVHYFLDEFIDHMK